MVHGVRTTAENRSCSNSTTATSFNSKQQKLHTQFIIIQIMVQYLEEDLIFTFIMTQTSIFIHMRILVIVIRMLHTFMVMLIHRLDFQEVVILRSRIMKSGESLLNDLYLFLYFNLRSCLSLLKVILNFCSRNFWPVILLLPPNSFFLMVGCYQTHRNPKG